MKKAVLFIKTKEMSVKCTACSWYCHILQNQSGICGVRQNKNGNLYLLVYGKAVAANIDPIEKKPLFHFLPGSKIFSIGTIGCNFACDFCQNWNISQISKNLNKEKKNISQYGKNLSPKEIVNYCIENNIPSIAFTYNEPAIIFEYALDTFKIAKRKGLKTVYVSNGYESKEQVKMLKGWLDAINIDLKSFSNNFYRKICKASLTPVLENIKRFYELNVWTEITTLIIPNENDSEKELSEISNFIAGISKNIPWHVSKFHPDFKMQNKTETPDKILKMAFDVGKKTGLKYVYIGNILNNNHENTICPKCNIMLIKRNYYDIEFKNINKGICNNCKTKIEGIWI